MSQIYDNAEQFETLFAELFAEIEATDPDGMDPLVKARMVIHFDVSDPDVDMWVDGREKPIQTSFAHSGSRPTLTAVLTGDTLHELLLGTLPLGKSLSRRRLKVKGSKWKALKLESLLHTCQAVYPRLAEEMLG